MKKFIKKIFSRNLFLRVTMPIILVIALVVIALFTFDAPKNLSEAQAKEKAEKFINDFLMTSGAKATVKEVTKEYGLYKLKVDIVSDVVDSYLSRDGKLFFPQALDINEINSTQNTAAASEASATDQSATVSVKTDKPSVELFVMSYCPYGTQIEKGILPVLETLGDKIDFELKFVDYAMHGEKEITENLTQYCIQEEEPEKLNAYLTCFLADSSQAAACLDQTGIKKSKIDSCVASADKKYQISENFKNNVGYKGSYPSFDVHKADNKKYSVGGSPTLIINGQEIRSGRDSASLLKTVCDAFNNQPQECGTVLSSASPSAGFGFGTTANAGAADCVQ